MSRYGWLHIIETLADRDLTKFDAILNRRASEVFTHLTYVKDYNDVQKQLMNQMKYRNHV